MAIVRLGKNMLAARCRHNERSFAASGLLRPFVLIVVLNEESLHN